MLCVYTGGSSIEQNHLQRVIILSVLILLLLLVLFSLMFELRVTAYLELAKTCAQVDHIQNALEYLAKVSPQ